MWNLFHSIPHIQGIHLEELKHLRELRVGPTDAGLSHLVLFWSLDRFSREGVLETLTMSAASLLIVGRWRHSGFRQTLISNLIRPFPQHIHRSRSLTMRKYFARIVVRQS